MTEQQTHVTSYRAALGLLLALERDPENPDLSLADEITDEYGAFEVLQGMSLVAIVLLQQLRMHAAGCSVGSIEWLEAKARDALLMEEDPKC
jgi:hypothetical protein